MADPTPPLVSPGSGTSEFSLTRLLVWLATGLSVLAGVTEAIKALIAALTSVPAGLSGPLLWLAITSQVVAALSAIYYKYTRKEIKVAAINAAAMGSDSDAKAAIDAA